MQLLSPLRLACGVTSPNRLVFGPHVTNLGHGRALSERHTAYYRRRACGGSGIIVTETASVHDSDWPYERAPLAARCAPGWAAIARACHDEGGLALAGLGHTGLQGTDAYGRTALWAPSDVADPLSREVPREMDTPEIAEIVAAFANAARLAVRSGMDGVEVDAGGRALIRQFLSAVTNLRADGYGGAQRTRFAREVLGAVRRAVGRGAVVGLRLCCDEPGTPGGITPETAPAIAAELAAAGAVDYVVVVRGSLRAPDVSRPDGHVPPGFNDAAARRVRAALPSSVAVCAQGSIVDPRHAEELLTEGPAALVEMTRAQIADARLGAKLAAGTPERVRPCVLCNQACQVRDPRNPPVSCIGDPYSGHESHPPVVPAPVDDPVEVLVIGAGPAGLETARNAAKAGHRVRVVEQRERTGGMLRVLAAGAGLGRLALLADWLTAECERLGVRIETGVRAGAADIDARLATGGVVVLCAGGRMGEPGYPIEEGAVVHDVAELLSLPEEELRRRLPAGPATVHDPFGGVSGVSVAETLAALGHEVTLVTPDHLVGARIATPDDRARALARLARARVGVVKRCAVRGAAEGVLRIEHVHTGETGEVKGGFVVECGFRLPDDGLWRGERLGMDRAGDVVAPRGVYEAILEGRRAAAGIEEMYR
ncbi:mycofactocin system FadH/OYE family oxidoreductase 1 [Marinactinospora thermotolerans]|uniref:Mycofactocin system FadH/OYE family oxidoreductase 1 n=1 Tax=Marinactinospora thermotolerans DSM 45154 TaxID=1122192 RepID=A0A1T4RQN0_9ACTN|nr:mycofactocin system FadH/OYE family oxidoreductase 1 [Marinactinospora thermotolerans]SKA17941.1 mycofactocin system FadH/OYE family oxidoreductase 1 [Marinactinospora thermotolerans DSM 45154]